MGEQKYTYLARSFGLSLQPVLNPHLSESLWDRREEGQRSTAQPDASNQREGQCKVHTTTGIHKQRRGEVQLMWAPRGL